MSADQPWGGQASPCSDPSSCYYLGPLAGVTCLCALTSNKREILILYLLHFVPLNTPVPGSLAQLSSQTSLLLVPHLP